jgi:hypothetical protein
MVNDCNAVATKQADKAEAKAENESALTPSPLQNSCNDKKLTGKAVKVNICTGGKPKRHIFQPEGTLTYFTRKHTHARTNRTRGTRSGTNEKQKQKSTDDPNAAYPQCI